MDNETNDRLKILEDKLARKKKRGSRLIWLTYNPGAEFDYDVEEASEDIRWMIFEIKRLREENKEYKEFVDSYKAQIEKELKLSP